MTALRGEWIFDPDLDIRSDMKKVSVKSGVGVQSPWSSPRIRAFRAEGIDMEFVRTRPSGAVPQTENPKT